ncbi:MULTISPECIES: hypothetical protein [unclassified Pseudomonas]|uniref:hypothetical protein n=1 Tax=unclassified Pseudomonas TaxID=196821 RepID=UPI0021144CF5|nr:MULTISPECIES: hypothetical protein [unclassified Pseudomonas]
MSVTLLSELLSRSTAGDPLNFRLEDQRIVRLVSVISDLRETLNRASYTFLKVLRAGRFV